MTYTFSGAGLNPAIKDNQVNQMNQTNQAGTSINIKNNRNSAKSSGVNGAFAGVVISKGNTRIENKPTYDALLKETEDVKSQIMESASTAKLGLKALMKKLSGADIVRIDEDGFNLTDATSEDCVNIIEKIRIELAMHSDDYVSYGTGVSKEAIEKVAGSEGGQGLTSEIASKINGNGRSSEVGGSSEINGNGEDVEQIEAALNKGLSLSGLSEEAKLYIVSNNVKPTIDGISEAQNLCGIMTGKTNPLSEEAFEGLRPQIENVISKAGLAVNNETIQNARLLIENQIPLTHENIIYLSKLDELDLSQMSSRKNELLDKIIDNVKLGNPAGNTLLIDSGTLTEEVTTAIKTLEKTTFEDVRDVVKSGETFTIANLKLSIEGRLNYGKGALSAQISAQISAQTTTQTSAQPGAQANVDNAYKLMVQARILLTAQAGAYLHKNNVSLMATPVSELVEELNHYDRAVLGEEIADSETYEEVNSVRMALDTIKYAPDTLFANVLKESSLLGMVSLSQLSDMGHNLNRQYKRAEMTYEAVGTEVRKDLGDSLRKAVDNSVDTFVKELELEGSKADKDAIRILAANGLEINKENVDKIKNSYEIVNNLIENMKPETVFKMIKDGVNPMECSIEELNEYLTAMNDTASKDNDEKFSRFLFKLDRTNGIDEGQRKKFIAIYQMMNIFRKDAGASVGALIKQGADITMSNLMTAYNSRKHYDFDKTVSDETGMAEVSGEVNYYTALFAQNGRFCTPNTLKNVDNSTGIDTMSVENFVEELRDNYDLLEEAKVYEEYLKAQVAAAEADSFVLRELKRAEADVTVNNIQAVKQMLESGQFPVIKGGKGGKNTADYSREAIDRIGDEKALKQIFDEMEDDVKQELQEAVSLAGDLDSHLDLNYEELLDLRIRNNQITYINNLAARHDYRIPYISENGDAGMINLTLVTDSEERGRVSVKLSDTEFGEMSIELKTNASSMNMFVVSEKELGKEGEDRINTLKDTLKTSFNLNEVELYLGVSSEVPYITYDETYSSVASETLYRMAKTVVEAMIQ